MQSPPPPNTGYEKEQQNAVGLFSETVDTHPLTEREEKIENGIQSQGKNSDNPHRLVRVREAENFVPGAFCPKNDGVAVAPH